MPSSKVLITDSVHPQLISGLRKLGYAVKYAPDISEEEVQRVIVSYTGLVINSKIFAGEELFARAPLLKFVCRLGSGMEVIDVAAAKSRKISAFNSPEGNRNAVAEHALGMLLSLMNYIPKADSEVRAAQWIREANRGNELSGKTVGLIAYGNTAQALAKLLRGFDVRILAYDKYKTRFGNKQVKESTLREIFREADVLSVHLPLTDETRYMINEQFLSSFKKPVWLVNTSRGKVLDTRALVTALGKGTLRGAALDVLENEKLATFSVAEKKVFTELIASQRVLLTPHIAGWTHESKLKIAEVLLKKIAALK